MHVENLFWSRMAAVAAAAVALAFAPFSPSIIAVAAVGPAAILLGTYRDRTRIPLISFAVISFLLEAVYGHDFLKDFGSLWFDNIVAGLLEPGAIVGSIWLFLLVIRDQRAEFQEWRTRRLGGKVVLPDAGSDIIGNEH